MKRRRVLLAALGPGLAGCQSLTTDPPMLDLMVTNHTDVAYELDLALFEADSEGSRSDARAFSRMVAVGPQETTRLEAAAEHDRYLVRYNAYEGEQGRLTHRDHVHYYPSDDERLVLDIHSDLVSVRR